MKRTSLVSDGLLALSALGLGAALVVAQARPQARQPAHDLLALTDVDGDGLLSEAEYDRASAHGLDFAAADADGSGAVEVYEIDVLIEFVSPMIFGRGALPRVR